MAGLAPTVRRSTVAWGNAPGRWYQEALALKARESRVRPVNPEGVQVTGQWRSRPIETRCQRLVVRESQSWGDAPG